MKHFFILLFFILLFFNYLTANQHYTLQNSIFVAIVDAARGQEQYKAKEFTEAITTFELALEKIQKYGTLEKIHNKFESGGIGIGKTEANNKMVSHVKYYLYLNIGINNTSKCQQDHQNNRIFCEKAITNFNKAIEILDNDKKKKYYNIYHNKGMAYLTMGIYEKAGENFREAIKRNPSFIDAHNALGIIYGRQAIKEEKNKKKEKKFLNLAKLRFNKSLEYGIENEDALNNLGEISYRLKKYAKAIKNFDKAIHINPIDSILYTNRGLTYEKLKQYTEACHNYNIAIKLNNMNPNIGRNRAKVFFNNLVISGYCSPLLTTKEMFKLEKNDDDIELLDPPLKLINKIY